MINLEAIRKAHRVWGDPTVNELLSVVDAQRRELAALKTDNTELNALFELEHARSMEAIALWREAHPGNELVQPDLGKLLAWLMAELAALKAKCAGLVVALEKYGECEIPCSDARMDAEMGTPDKTRCTCGLIAALTDAALILQAHDAEVAAKALEAQAKRLHEDAQDCNDLDSAARDTYSQEARVWISAKEELLDEAERLRKEGGRS